MVTRPPRRLRIGFDGRALVSPAGGVRRYTSELYAAMAAAASEVDIIALGAPPHIELPAGVMRGPAPPSLPSNLGWSLTGGPVAAWRGRIDVFHAPAYTAPLAGVHPLVLTIHDVSYERHPEWFPYRRGPLRRWFYRRSALAADRVITDSTFSAGEITAAYAIDATRISVIPLGVGRPFTDPPATSRPSTGDYVLHVGDLHPRRNLAVALDAVLDVRGKHARFRDLTLVLVGVDRGSLAQLKDHAAKAGAQAAIDFVSGIDDEGLRAMYEGAAALIYPSRYEGFGLPLVEAMATGTPVIAARAGSIPEVAGDAALLVDPDDRGGFTAALERVLVDAAYAQQLRERGRARSATFTWARAAQLTLEAFRATIARA
jgi:O-antigen biosynthesis alpha-1,3-rhamnosyltransferase